MPTGPETARTRRLLVAALLALLVPLVSAPLIDEDDQGWLVGFSSAEDASGPGRAVPGEPVELVANAPVPTLVLLAILPAGQDPEPAGPTRLGPSDRAPPRV
jgi:hypothetical protein